MKKILILLILAGTFLFANDLAAQQTPPSEPAVQTAETGSNFQKNPSASFCIDRGFCNILTGWLELPRCMFYNNGYVPIIGLFCGIPEGVFFTAGRTLCGVFDLVSFGMSGSTCHSEIFPDFVFQAQWNYPKK